tara:strand:- start:23 stop:598 length:576 start_codon:yes stop_codon:yes gene_type:complete
MVECNELNLEDKQTKRTGKEIRVDGSIFDNENLKFKIGTCFQKQSPETIYVELSFWVDIKEKHFQHESDKYSFLDYDYEISKKLTNYIRNIYRQDLKDFLTNNKTFPYYLENIYVYDFPENINYNNKRSFVSIELNVHTINLDSSNEKKYPLSEKGERTLLDETLKICNIISNSDLLKNKTEFSIHKSKKG